jgi:putative RNA 2'-phosphotransferase
MDPKNKKRGSKFISLLLRHKPGDLVLDSRGCCKLDDLLRTVNDRMKFRVTKEDVIELTLPSEDPNVKTRFELEGEFIRAGHGHSISIEGYEELEPTAPLYHASTAKNFSLIKQNGLLSMNRHKVHLAYDKAITREAAKRRSKMIVLIGVNLAAAKEQGVKFYRSADERIILSDDIPANCLRFERWIKHSHGPKNTCVESCPAHHGCVEWYNND